MICFANGVTSGMVPMGGVIVREPIYETFMGGPEHATELRHGCAFSGHPLACAAGLAALDIYEQERLFARVHVLEQVLASAVHGLRGLPNVQDIRNAGLNAAVDLSPKPGARGMRGFAAMEYAFRECDLLLRATGDTLILAPPLIVSEAQIGEIVEKTAQAIKAVA
jgi:beta-alanine--pyruvate transaminase